MDVGISEGATVCTKFKKGLLSVLSSVGLLQEAFFEALAEENHLVYQVVIVTGSRPVFV